ncbi:MAG: RNase H family protein, partial [Planctomycetota bacterium]
MSSVGTRKKNRPTHEHIQEAELKQLCQTLKINDRLQLKLVQRGDINSAIVTEVSRHRFAIQYKDATDDDGTTEEAFIPDDDDIIEYRIIKNLPGLPNFTHSSRILNAIPTWVIYTDGSSSQNTTVEAPSAAAIVIKHMDTKQCFVLSVFSPSSTNNICEWVATIAALRATLLLPGTTAIIQDSELVFKQLFDSAAVKSPNLVAYHRLAKDTMATVQWHNVSVHTMPGHDPDCPQLADYPAKITVNT